MSRRDWTAWLEGAGGSAKQPPVARMAPTPRPKPRRPSSVQLQAHRAVELKEIRALDLAVPDVQEVDIQPVPKPRMTQADRWAKRDCVLRYRAYCDILRLRGLKLPHAYRLEFVLPMPESWSEATKATMDGQPHLVRPDTSNLVKAVEDALVPRDERLHDIRGTKMWGRVGRLRIIKIARHGENFQTAGDVLD